MIEKICVPECYREFHCIDVECSDSCCAGWQVDVDEESYEEYIHVKGEYGDYIRSVMTQEGDCGGEKAQFQLREDGRCPFLLDNGLCDMYAHLGEESLCHTCTNFPRYMEDYATLREMGIGFSCPEVSRLMLASEKKMEYIEMTLDNHHILKSNSFVQNDDSDKILDSGLISSARNAQKACDTHLINANTLSGDNRECQEWEGVAQDVMNRTRRIDRLQAKQTDTEKETFQQDYFTLLHTCRNTAFSIVTNRELTIPQRVLLYLDYSVCLQDVLDHAQSTGENTVLKDISDSMNVLVEQYKDACFLKERCRTLCKEVEGLPLEHSARLLYGEPVAKNEMSYCLVPEYAAVIYQELRHCKPQWADLLEEAEQVLHKDMDAQEYADCYQEFDVYYQKQMYEYEHLLNYYVFRYFLKSYFDDDIYGKAKIAVMGYIMVKELAVCQWLKQGKVYTKQNQIELFHLYARELEHSDENYEQFYEALQTEDFCNWEHLKVLLCERIRV